MMAETRSNLSDEAVAIFAFAAYHQLGSGQPVKSVIAKDGSGHQADEKAVSELTSRGLAEQKGNDICFTDDGLSVLSRAVDALKGAAAAA